MEEYKNQIIGAVVAGLLTIIAIFFTSLKRVATHLFKRVEHKLTKGETLDLLRTLADFHQTIELIRDRAFVDRVLMFEATNCGGPPDPLKPYTIFCFYGWSNQDSHPELLYAHKIVIDSHYMRVLVELMEKGQVLLKTKDIPERSLLRSYYAQEGVNTSLLFLLQSTPERITYLSVANYKREYTQDEETELGLIVARLKHVIKDSD